MIVRNIAPTPGGMRPDSAHGYAFTERARRSIAEAREAAASLGQAYIGTEHLLLGLLREGQGVASAALTSLAVDAEALEEFVLQQSERGDWTAPAGFDLAYSRPAKKALELAMAEARELGHPYVGTEHLLLGVAREEKGLGARALAHFGATAASLRAAIVRILGETQQEPPRHGTTPISENRRVRRVRLELGVFAGVAVAVFFIARAAGDTAMSIAPWALLAVFWLLLASRWRRPGERT